MLAALAADWGLLLFRAVIAIVFGVVALALPGPTTIAVALLFGAYTLVDGIVALIVAIHGKGSPGLGIEAFVRFGASFVALAMTAGAFVALPVLLAVWAGLSGLCQIAEALVLREELIGEWPLPVAGTLSILVAVFLFATPGIGVAALVWLIGAFSIVFGIALLVLA